jgi:hypothetical protein
MREGIADAPRKRARPAAFNTEGRPIQTLPDGSTWTVFCTMEFLQMPQVTVDIA